MEDTLGADRDWEVMGYIAVADVLRTEAAESVRRLRANAQPVAGAVFVELHALARILGEQRIVGADLLEILAVARAAAVGDDDAVIGTLLGTAARKPDGSGHMVYLSSGIELNC